ncbi:hypothetical protein QHH03_30170, partial [Aphanizomenon sp. 202]|nr:hypothetical protein [Aphanizomenon sp. 202]
AILRFFTQFGFIVFTYLLRLRSVTRYPDSDNPKMALLIQNMIDFTSRRGAPVAESKSLNSLIFQFHTSVQQRPKNLL